MILFFLRMKGPAGLYLTDWKTSGSTPHSLKPVRLVSETKYVLALKF